MTKTEPGATVALSSLGLAALRTPPEIAGPVKKSCAGAAVTHANNRAAVQKLTPGHKRANAIGELPPPSFIRTSPVAVPPYNFPVCGLQSRGNRDDPTCEFHLNEHITG